MDARSIAWQKRSALAWNARRASRQRTGRRLGGLGRNHVVGWPRLALASTLRLVTGNVRLTPVDEQILEPLSSVVIAETEPDEVMPPVKAPGGWSQVRWEAFREFDRASYGGLRGPTSTLMYAIVCDGDFVGMIRMARRDEPDTMETGTWLGESACGTATHRPVGRGCGLHGETCARHRI